MANPIEEFSAATPCSDACARFDVCPLATQCLDSVEGICEFQTSVFRNSPCAGNLAAMYYICLPLKRHIGNGCSGLPAAMCYEDNFSATARQRFVAVRQANAPNGQVTTNSNNGAYRDMLQWTAQNPPVIGRPQPSLLVLVNDATANSWQNYLITANFRVNNPNFSVFKAEPTNMVGVTFRHAGNAQSGKVHPLCFEK